MRCMLLVLMMLLWGCSSEAQTVPEPSQDNEEDREKYEVPEYAEAVFHETEAIADGDALFDISAVDEGYVAVSAVSDRRLKFAVIKDEIYYYDLMNDGTPTVFPLQSGDGHYVFRVYEHIIDSSYAVMGEIDADVTLADEFQPYIRTNSYVPRCVCSS